MERELNEGIKKYIENKNTAKPITVSPATLPTIPKNYTVDQPVENRNLNESEKGMPKSSNNSPGTSEK